MSKSKTKSKLNKFQSIDYSLLLMVVFLLGFGLVMLYSSSAYIATLQKGDSLYFLKRQIFAAIVGFAGMIFAISMGYKGLAKLAPIIYIIAFILCVAVNFVGVSLNNSSRWIRIGGFSFQPSEIGKVAIILIMAIIITKTYKTHITLKNTAKALAWSLPIVTVVAYNNLSTGIIILGIAVIMLFVANKKYSYFILIGIFAALLAFIFIKFVGYRQNRIDMWLHPEEYGEAYQTLQGLYAIGSGKLFGKGLGESTQKLGFVPEAQNDMIFTIICEELGVFGAVCVILMYVLIIWRLCYIAAHANDMLGAYIVIGIMAHLTLQVVLNIAVVTNSIPNTGVTLPFISYGGSSLMILLSEIGIALSVSSNMHSEEE